MPFLRFLQEKGIINQELVNLIEEKIENQSLSAHSFLLNVTDLSEKEIAILIAEYCNIEYTDLPNFTKIDNLNYEHLKNINAIPFDISEDTIHIAVNDPNDLSSSDKINAYLDSFERTKHLTKKYYTATQSDIISKFQEVCENKQNLLDKIIFNATNLDASDIHITPYEKNFEIQFRIDGDLSQFKINNIEEFQSLAISLKVLAKLNISETRRPQSGHFQRNNIDFRISTHPTIHGENIVIRILNKNKNFISIENLGFSKEKINILKKITAYSNGMIVFCGPTGSGKTTSIYSLLDTIDKKSKNIITLEDPIEYKIANVKQTEINSGVINFSDGIRSILRQDPDIILIGEIRDEETAQMAIRASMTGHLVLTTVHSNDSFGAITRFEEFGISRSLIADNIIAIISQRLVKKISGGRTIISEILEITTDINTMLYSGKGKNEILEHANRITQFKSIKDDCVEKVRAGVISENDMINILRMAVN